jgi:hypothetical protein
LGFAKFWNFPGFRKIWEAQLETTRGMEQQQHNLWVRFEAALTELRRLPFVVSGLISMSNDEIDPAIDLVGAE